MKILTNEKLQKKNSQKDRKKDEQRRNYRWHEAELVYAISANSMWQ